MKAAAMLAVLGVLSSMLVTTMGYAIGPPIVEYPDVCKSMFPEGHLAEVSANPAPFDVKASCHCYVPGKPIYVNYQVQTGNDPLEGFFVQARKTTGNIQTNTAVGNFTVNPARSLQTLNCNGNTASAASHSAEVKERNKGSCWNVPDNLNNAKVKFVATALLHKATFWTFVSSVEIKTCPGGTVPAECAEDAATIYKGFPQTVIDDAKLCNKAATLHPVGLVTVLSSLLVLLTTVIRL